MRTNELKKRAARIEKEIAELLIALKPDIDDDYRASDDPADTTPAMQITIAVDNELTQWNYQTGDNSFSGACYGLPYWGVSSLQRRSNCKELARELLTKAIDQINP